MLKKTILVSTEMIKSYINYFSYPNYLNIICIDIFSMDMLSAPVVEFTIVLLSSDRMSDAGMDVVAVQ